MPTREELEQVENVLICDGNRMPLHLDLSDATVIRNMRPQAYPYSRPFTSERFQRLADAVGNSPGLDSIWEYEWTLPSDDFWIHYNAIFDNPPVVAYIKGNPVPEPEEELPPDTWALNF